MYDYVLLLPAPFKRSLCFALPFWMLGSNLIAYGHVGLRLRVYACLQLL